jgi:hypothetical protein
MTKICFESRCQLKNLGANFLGWGPAAMANFKPSTIAVVCARAHTSGGHVCMSNKSQYILVGILIQKLPQKSIQNQNAKN